MSKGRGKERWKDIPEYVGYYQISDHGRVKSLEREVPHLTSGKLTVHEKMLSNKTEHSLVSLNKDGIRRAVTIARLVAEAFLPNPNNYPEVRHKNTYFKNDHYTNLEWSTHSDTIYGAIKNNPDSFNLCNKLISQYELNGQLIASYPSAAEAARQTKLSRSTIAGCAAGKFHTCGDYIWRYDEYDENGDLIDPIIEPRNHSTFLNKKPVNQFTLDGEKIASYPSVKEAARETGLGATGIGNCLSRRTKTSGGYKWEYDNP